MTRRVMITTVALLFGLTAYYATNVISQEEGEEKVQVDPTSLNIRPGFSGTEVLGEVVNESDFLIGRVKVTITMKDAVGKVLDTDFTYVRGMSVEISGFSDDSGIEPGGRAVFSETLTKAELDSVDTTLFNINFDVADPRTDFDQTPLHLRVTALDSAVQSLDARTGVLDTDGRTPTSGLLGDLDSDGDVDFSDFIMFASNFGKSLS